ncbi:tektin-1-like [Centruroides vittatus]|uniref:tektin-1-like n=1 Tax=Centruroides vittatus TaxID=120091 RepID=UPI00350F4FDA
MAWLKMNEASTERFMEWTSLGVQDLPCRFHNDQQVPLKKLARTVHAYKQPFIGPQRGITNSLLYKAAHCLHDAVDVRENCEEDREKGELWTRQTYNMSDKDYSFWQKTERYEIDRIADTDLQCNFIIRELLKIISNVERHLVITEKCLELRINILNITADSINKALENERDVIEEIINDLKAKVEELEKHLKRLRLIRPYLQKDVQYKTIAASINQSCQHNDRLLLYREPPNVTTEPPKLQKLNCDVWNDNVNNLIKTSTDIREACCNSCRGAEQVLQECKMKLHEAWKATDNALGSEIEKNNARLDRIRAEITAVLYDIQLSDQRTLSLRRSGYQEQHALQLAIWRQQREFLKPPREQIQDRCSGRIEEELKASDGRTTNIELCLRKNEEIHSDLQARRYLLEKQYDTISLHLFVDREYCEGLRRSVQQQQPTECLAKRTRFQPTSFPWRWKLSTKGVSACVCY